MQAAKVIVLPITQHSVFSCSVSAVRQLIFKLEENSTAAPSEFLAQSGGNNPPFALHALT